LVTLIEDGATLQLGIGAIPHATLQALADRFDLVERGVISGVRKSIDRGKILASFVIGSRRLLDFIDDNPIVELRSSDYTNNTQLIRQFERMDEPPIKLGRGKQETDKGGKAARRHCPDTAALAHNHAPCAFCP
jgi:hypothetical protein